MNDEQFITHSRESFAILRWAPIVAVTSLPFTFARGPIPAALFVGAVPIASTWLLSLLLAWRTRSQFLLGLSMVIVFVGPYLVGVHSSEVPLPQALQ